MKPQGCNSNLGFYFYSICVAVKLTYSFASACLRVQLSPLSLCEWISSCWHDCFSVFASVYNKQHDCTAVTARCHLAVVSPACCSPECRSAVRPVLPVALRCISSCCAALIDKVHLGTIFPWMQPKIKLPPFPLFLSSVSSSMVVVPPLLPEPHRRVLDPGPSAGPYPTLLLLLQSWLHQTLQDAAFFSVFSLPPASPSPSLHCF